MKKIKIYLAENAGFCSGVKRAVALAFKEAGADVYSFGDLVHNEIVVKELEDLGVKTIDKTDIKDKKVIIRSHGVHKSILDELKDNNNEIINCVCPKVEKIYKIVEKYYREGYNIVIIGDYKHPEVIGINSYCEDKAVIINSLDDIIIPSGKILVVSQTTNEEEFFEKAVKLIKSISNDEVLVYNTICNATFKRQQSIRELAKEMDAVIVLGGKKSSNTKKLKKVANKYCENVFLFQSIKDVDLKFFKKFNKIGITAGASTPDSVIEEAVSSMENFDKGEMIKAIDNTFKKVRKGEVVDGEVLYVTDNEVMVNLGYRADGIISKEELSNDPDVKPSDLYKPGDEVQIYILKMDDGEGNVMLSRKRVEEMLKWDEIQELYEKGEKVEVEVKAVVKGGLTGYLKGIKVFIPASHVSVRFKKDLNQFVGQKLCCYIIDFDKSKKRVVLSRKKVEAEEAEDKKKEVFESLHEGDVIEGKVQRLTNFGAFVDVGGIDGLVHVTELSWNRVKHPSDVVSVGDVIEVKVLNLDEEKGRIALGLKQTTEKPWDKFISEVSVGDVLTGKVVNLLDFGAFVRLQEGVDGLLHVSQIAREHVEKPADKLNIGDEIEVKVTDIDLDNKKVSLSRKVLLEPTPEEIERAEARKKKKMAVKKQPKPQPRKKKFELPKQEEFNMPIGELININLPEDFNTGE